LASRFHDFKEQVPILPVVHHERVGNKFGVCVGNILGVQHTMLKLRRTLQLHRRIARVYTDRPSAKALYHLFSGDF
jgi:hypothetical protein